MKRHLACITDKAKRLSLIAIMSIIVAAVPFSSAFSEDYDYQEVEYDVYAGGIHAVRANTIMDFEQDGRYIMGFGAETRGFLGSLVPWAGTFETRGWSLPGPEHIRQPETHVSTATWRGEEETKTYRYDKEKGFLDLTTLYTGKKPKKEKTEEELTKGTTDIISATLMVMERVSDGSFARASMRFSTANADSSSFSTIRAMLCLKKRAITLMKGLL